MGKSWALIGFDTLANEWYEVSFFEREAEAARAGLMQLQEIEKTQPTVTSGGQADYGIQDRVYIQRPDGTRYRLLP
ncbi:MAG TPA: hypothetical protein VE981_21160 [Planctomycetota bacterium]|nr:hypothetical protein [Planctomycetota bacterium]